MKKFTENFTLFIFVGKKEFLKTALCNHCNPAELVFLKVENCLYCLIYLRKSRHRIFFFTQISQNSRSRFLCCSISTANFSFIIRVSYDFIFVSIGFEFKFNYRRSIFISKMRTKHINASISAAWTSIKSKSYGIKNRSLSSTCITCNKVQPIFTKIFKIYFSFVSVGFKSSHYKL